VAYLRRGTSKSNNLLAKGITKKRERGTTRWNAESDTYLSADLVGIEQHARLKQQDHFTEPATLLQSYSPDGKVDPKAELTSFSA